MDHNHLPVRLIYLSDWINSNVESFGPHPECPYYFIQRNAFLPDRLFKTELSPALPHSRSLHFWSNLTQSPLDKHLQRARHARSRTFCNALVRHDRTVNVSLLSVPLFSVPKSESWLASVDADCVILDGVPAGGTMRGVDVIWEANLNKAFEWGFELGFGLIEIRESGCWNATSRRTFCNKEARNFCRWDSSEYMRELLRIICLQWYDFVYAGIPSRPHRVSSETHIWLDIHWTCHELCSWDMDHARKGSGVSISETVNFFSGFYCWLSPHCCICSAGLGSYILCLFRILPSSPETYFTQHIPLIFLVLSIFTNFNTFRGNMFNPTELQSLLDTSRPFDEPKVRLLEQSVNQMLTGQPEDVRYCYFLFAIL